MNFNPFRLTIARQRKLLKKKDFADLMGVTPHTVTRWETDKVEPNAHHIKLFSQILGYPQAFFFGSTLDRPEAHETSFRSQTSMTAAVRDAALAAGAIGFLVSNWVERHFDLPKTSIPDMSQYKADVAARSLRELWGLGEAPISNMVHLLESKGVRVFSLAENTMKVNAYSLWREGVPFVFLNTVKTAECSRFDAAHELAHLVLHPDGKATGREAEDQANRFASSFLMSKADVLAQIPRVTHIGQLIEVKSRWKVSLVALCYRCHKLGIISDWKYRDYCISINKKYGKSEPKGIEWERSKVWSLVLQSLWKDGLGQAQIAKDLDIPQEEVNGLFFSIVQSKPNPQPPAKISRKLKLA